MSGDYSRVRFDPLRDHSGVGMQQGRVWLDADFNEQVAITDRRLRAQVADLAPTPATVSRLTPKAFEITVSGDTMSIGAGRMYVDGLLAENHGATLGFDSVLAEPNGTGAVAYAKQPYGPVPEQWTSPPEVPDLPTTPGPHLVFLDVWERELTHLTTSDLVEPALGRDTTTRTQVVWQVRVLADVEPNATRDSVIAKWDTLIAPSSARLTTSTVDEDPGKDPCLLPPANGYRGLENQLYRVELHSATQFKWSRDNATVASVVEQTLSATRLRLASLGRDEVLAIKSHDWVEITDDRRELAQTAGFMVQVMVEDDRVISLSADLPDDLFHSTSQLRVRKWDSPLIAIPTDGSPVVLERSVAVSFSFAAVGVPHPGDYWVFAARVDTSLEELVAAAPRGIHHHYARLALVTAPDHVLDRRPEWPIAAGDSCGCEICVTPESHASGEFTLHDAVARLKKARGGTLSLCPGTYTLAEPLELRGVASVTVRGAGQATRVVAHGTAIAVSVSTDVVLQDFAVRSEGANPTIAFSEANKGCRLEGLRIDHPTRSAIGLTGAQMSVTVRDCLVTAATGVSASELLTSDLSIQDNAFACGSRGVDLGIDHGGAIVHTGRTVIAGNTVTGCSDAAIVVTGLVPQDVAGADGALHIHHNLVEITGSAIVTGGRTQIIENTLVAARRRADRHGIMLESSPPDTPQGTVRVSGNKISGFGGYGLVASAELAGLTVADNVIRGTAGGILVQPELHGGSATVSGNQVQELRPVTSTGLRPEAARGGSPVIERRDPPTASPTRSVPARETPTMTRSTGLTARFRGGFTTSRTNVEATTSAVPPGTTGSAAARFDLPDPDIAAALLGRAANTFSTATLMMGIGIVGVATVVVVDNTVDGIASAAQDAAHSRSTYGIAVDTCVTARIAGNTVARIGPATTGVGEAYGIRCGGWQDTVSVCDNMVLSGASVRSGWNAVALLNVPALRLGRVRSIEISTGMFTFAGGFSVVQKQTSGHIELNGNTVEGGGTDVAVSIVTSGEVIMHANRCVQAGTGDQAVVRVNAAAAVVQGNRLRGGDPSMTVLVANSAAVVLGNMTTGGIQVGQKSVENTTKPVSALNTMG